MAVSRAARASIATALVATLAFGVAAVEPGDGPNGDAEAAPLPRSAIVGGRVAHPERWRFTVALFWKERLLCGGSVIAPTKVLTAAHCVKGKRPSTLAVIAGRPRLRAIGVGERMPVAAKAVDPGFRWTRSRYDVAVLTLASATSAPPIGLPTAVEDAAVTGVRAPVRVAGWGARDPFGFRLPGFLKEARQWVLPPRRCRRAYRRLFVRHAMICALGREMPRRRTFLRLRLHAAACFGDSGGPLVADTASGPRVVGIVSFSGFICGDPIAPSVYTRVAEHLRFIAAA